MRFMMIVKANPDSEAGKMPEEALMAEMMRFNEALVKAGVLLDGAGLQSSSKGVRMKFSGGTRTLVDGPFPETRQLIAGYWIIQVKSREEALEWLKRVPAPHTDGEAEIELRQFFELEDFAPSPAIDHARRLEQEQKKK
jgi:hypothetical protein